MTDLNEPIACTLTGRAYDEGQAWIAELNRDGLQQHQREGLSLHLIYTIDVVHRLRELILQEAKCCAFLAFSIDESESDVHVTITVPNRARESADEVLSPFLPTRCPLP